MRQRTSTTAAAISLAILLFAVLQASHPAAAASASSSSSSSQQPHVSITLDEFKHIYEMGSTWDVETFKQTGGQPPDDGDADAPGGEPSLTDFKLKMNEIKQDLISLVKTRVSLVVSFLAINMRTLKETLKNICDRVLDDLKRLVLDISAKKVGR